MVIARIKLNTPQLLSTSAPNLTTFVTLDELRGSSADTIPTCAPVAEGYTSSFTHPSCAQSDEHDLERHAEMQSIATPGLSIT